MYPVETPSPEVGAVSQTFLQGSSLNEVFVCLCGVIQSGRIPALFRWVTSLLKGLITLVRVTGQCLLMFDRDPDSCGLLSDQGCHSCQSGL